MIPTKVGMLGILNIELLAGSVCGQLLPPFHNTQYV